MAAHSSDACLRLDQSRKLDTGEIMVQNMCKREYIVNISAQRINHTSILALLLKYKLNQSLPFPTTSKTLASKTYMNWFLPQPHHSTIGMDTTFIYHLRSPYLPRVEFLRRGSVHAIERWNDRAIEPSTERSSDRINPAENAVEKEKTNLRQ